MGRQLVTRDRRTNDAGKPGYYAAMRDRLDALSKTRALTDAESRQLERAVYHAG